MLRFTSPLIVSSLFLVSLGGCVGATEADQRKIRIEGPSRAVHGFPIVLRIVASGPLEVPRASVYRDLADIHVNVSQTRGEKTYRFASNASMTMDRADMKGHLVTDGRDFFNERLRKDEEMAILVDVFSLRYAEGHFRDLPPGQYTISVTFPHAKETSEAKALELVAPGPADRAFLDEVVEPEILPRRREIVSWSRVLGESKTWRVPIDKGQQLPQPAKGQMQLHLLLYQIQKGEVRSRRQAEPYQVPKYLELEKQWVLLKLDRANKVAGAEEALQAFVETHPEFRWRLQPAYPGSNLFQNIAD